MATPSPRTPVRPGRGLKAALDTALTAGDIKEGEIVYAKDEDKLYIVEGGVFVIANGGGGTIQGAGDFELNQTTGGQAYRYATIGTTGNNSEYDQPGECSVFLSGDRIICNGTDSDGLTTIAAAADAAVAANGGSTSLVPFWLSIDGGAYSQYTCTMASTSYGFGGPFLQNVTPDVVLGGGAEVSIAFEDPSPTSTPLAEEDLIKWVDADQKFKPVQLSSLLAASKLRNYLGIGEYASDGAAIGGGVQESHLYYNTTENGYVLRGPVATDPLFADVQLLLRMDGTDGSQTIVDDSLNGYTPSSIDPQATLSTSVFKFGTASLFCNNINLYEDQKVQYSVSSGSTFGTGNFTIETWVRIGAGSFSSANVIFSPGGAFNGLEWYGNTTQFYWRSTGTGAGSAPLTQDTWHHVAVVRVGTTVTIYLDGVACGTTITDSLDYTSTSWAVGGRADNQYGLAGYIDDLRVTKAARYTSDFTPPTESYPGS